MGKISQIHYKEIPVDVMGSFEAGEFYYYQNLKTEHPSLMAEYESYEMKQESIRGKVINDLIKEDHIKEPKISSTIVGISSSVRADPASLSFHDQVVLIMEH